MSTSVPGQHTSVTSRVFGAFGVLSLAGMVLLAVTAVVGFEEPNSTLFLTSLALVLAAPAAMLVHLAATRQLTGSEKRIWIRELAGPRAARSFSAYLTSHDRSATAGRLAAEASARSQQTRT
jgi:peptidoglycan/LPS O-acetylase OafA/YrhL